MHNSPSDRCGDCPWWHEGPIMCIDCPNHPEADTWNMPCSQCKQLLFVGEFYEIAFTEDGLLLLCSKKCKDRWASSVTAEKHPVLEEQAFGSNPS